MHRDDLTSSLEDPARLPTDRTSLDSTVTRVATLAVQAILGVRAVVARRATVPRAAPGDGARR